MVMRKTQRKHLFKTIQKNIVSFLAVALMAATGISIYVGDQSAAKAILESANNYFVNNQLQSFEVSSLYGITEADIDAMKELEGIDEVEGGYSTIGIWDADNGTGKMPIRVHSLLDKMNLPIIVDGTLPEEANQAAIEQKMANQEGIKVGDRIVVEHDGELKMDTFLVTAIINQPSYCCAKSLDSRGMNNKGIGSAYYYIALQEEAFDSTYFSNCYTTAYVKSNELDKYFYFSDEYKDKEAAIKETLLDMGEKRASVRLAEVQESAGVEIATAEETLQKYEVAIENAKELVKELDVSEKYYDKMMEELQKAESRLDDGYKELQMAKDELLLLEKENWIVSIRNDIGDVRSIDIIVEGLYGLSYSLALIFVVVSITVCYSAISRMINEQRNYIGMQKALGFTSREILQHYMGYSIICGLVGVFEGIVASIFSVQFLNLKIYESVFLLGKIPLSFSLGHAILISVFFMIIFILSSYAACKKEISLPATDLLRGEIVEREKPFLFERFGFYKKRKLYTRIMIKNVLGDKPRMTTTIVGVAGCILLLVISFTMLIAMQESAVVQFDDYFLYDNRLIVDTSKGNAEDFEEILKEEAVEYIRIQDKLRLYREVDGNWSGAHVVVASDADKLKEFMVLENPDTRAVVELPETGMLVSLKCVENHNLKANDVLEITDKDGTPKQVAVAGEIEHFLPYNLFVMSENYYEEVMGEATDDCVFLLKGNIDGLYNKVKDVDGFLSLRDNEEYIKMNNALYLVVIICFVFAIVMAVLVMLNQNVMHINRKAKELSVMRINGFTMKETKAFVSRDNVFLTTLGILLGWLIGIIFGYLVIRILEVATTHYVRTPSLKACLISATIGGVFAYIMNKIALRKIRKLNLTNVNAN